VSAVIAITEIVWGCKELQVLAAAVKLHQAVKVRHQKVNQFALDSLIAELFPHRLIESF
jgi:hypothetical protein